MEPLDDNNNPQIIPSPSEISDIRKKHPSPAFVFDIDGVFLKGGTLLPRAGEAFLKVKERKVPYIFLTNSTGCNRSKAILLTKLMGIEVKPEEVIMAQSPVKDLFEDIQMVSYPDPTSEKDEMGTYAENFAIYKDKYCLLVSSNNDKGEETFAKLIGLKRENYITCAEIDRLYPNLDWMNRAKWPKEVDTSPRIADNEFRPIDCIVLLGEPVNWERNCQIILDVILGKGHPNIRNPEYPNIKNKIPIIAANLDLSWKGAANMPRFGNGAFLLILETLYKKFTGNTLEYEKMFGKPSHHTYEFCLKRLRQLYPDQKIETIIGIGDNPQSDIAGANNIKMIDKKHSWLSVLVETGVYARRSSRDFELPPSMETEGKPNHAHRDFKGIPIAPDYLMYDLYEVIESFTN